MDFLEFGVFQDFLGGMDRSDLRVRMETEATQVQPGKSVQRVTPVIQAIPGRCTIRMEVT